MLSCLIINLLPSLSSYHFYSSCLISEAFLPCQPKVEVRSLHFVVSSQALLSSISRLEIYLSAFQHSCTQAIPGPLICQDHIQTTHQGNQCGCSPHKGSNKQVEGHLELQEKAKGRRVSCTCKTMLCCRSCMQLSKCIDIFLCVNSASITKLPLPWV